MLMGVLEYFRRSTGVRLLKYSSTSEEVLEYVQGRTEKHYKTRRLVK